MGDVDGRAEEGVVAGGLPERGHVGAARRVQPKGVAFEWVGGQLDRAGGTGKRPGDPGPLNLDLGGGAEDPLQAAMVAPQGAGRAGVRVWFEGLLDGGGEDGVGADLDEGGVPVLDEGFDGGVQQYGFAQVAVPVLAVQFPGVSGCPVTVE
nr:hypothetical protein [Actinomadura sp. WMMB 499]